MGLRLTLKPFERLIINGAAIRNGDRPVSFLIENQCKFLRESEIMHESGADTGCKKLCVTLHVLYLAEVPAAAIELFYAQARDLLAMEPSYAPYLSKIQNEVEAEQYYKAVKLGRELIAYERNFLDPHSLKAHAI